MNLGPWVLSKCLHGSRCLWDVIMSYLHFVVVDDSRVVLCSAVLCCAVLRCAVRVTGYMLGQQRMGTDLIDLAGNCMGRVAAATRGVVLPSYPPPGWALPVSMTGCGCLLLQFGALGFSALLAHMAVLILQAHTIAVLVVLLCTFCFVAGRLLQTHPCPTVPSCQSSHSQCHA